MTGVVEAAGPAFVQVLNGCGFYVDQELRTIGRNGVREIIVAGRCSELV
jgi:hypothetical protein